MTLLIVSSCKEAASIQPFGFLDLLSIGMNLVASLKLLACYWVLVDIENWTHSGFRTLQSDIPILEWVSLDSMGS